MSSNAAEFNRRIAQRGRETGLRIEQRIASVRVATLATAVELSPIGPRAGDGQFKGAWRLTTQREMEAPDTPDKDGSETIARAMSDGALIAPFEIAYAVNAMPYSGRIENGWSDQAPQGVVSVTAMRMRDELSAGG